jgi:hypothetical protein
MNLIEQLRSKKKALTVEELAGLLWVAVRTLYEEVEDDPSPSSVCEHLFASIPTRSRTGWK